MRGHLFSAAVTVALGVACGVDVNIEGKACPCATGEGYVCDPANNRCVRPEALTKTSPPPAACDPCPCEKDGDCTDPTRPVCSPASKTCVECVPGTADKCRVGTYCNAKFQCTTGCKTSEECVQLSGTLAPFCSLDRRQCVACLDSSTCNGKTCSPGGSCVDTCSPSKPCAGGQECCGELCLDVSTDVLNCGGCGVACTSDNGSPKCTGGKCQSDCADGFANCSGDPTTGCETSIRTVTHCGSCTSSCEVMVHVQGRACTSGKCSFATCEEGWGNFDGDAMTGCEGKCGAKNDRCCPENTCLAGFTCNQAAGKCQ